jgi:catechol 2,3-dioxygenase-like lactoylglutathione lyase family enzyme
MLNAKTAMPNIATKNIEVARKFYEETLGLEKVHVEFDQVLNFKNGGSMIIVYVSEFAGSNKATALTWSVGAELEEIVKTLGSKGVAFEHYEMPHLKREGDIHVAGDMKMAWFKDPDGNILGLINR